MSKFVAIVGLLCYYVNNIYNGESMQKIHIALDLGGDSLKIAFAYNDNGNIRYGKLSNKSKLTQVAIPSLAYYDIDAQKWFFGHEIGKQSESFLTVVKVKDLISLLVDNEALSADADVNATYYRKNNHFPKFYFPSRRKMMEDFGEMVNKGMTFIVNGSTPETVCLNYFRYVYALVKERLTALQRALKVVFDEICVAIVHPSNVGDEYLNELTSIIRQTFGVNPTKVLSTNKSLAMNALIRNMVKNGDEFLVFDMGEESINVVRAGVVNGSVAIYGLEGHSYPLEIGGNDIDEAIFNYIENTITSRETIGTPSVGAQGHITESSVYDKQYLLMKDIKKAKVIFSKQVDDTEYFKDGVPVTLVRDLVIQRNLTSENVKESIGVSNNNGVARQILDYVVKELSLPINHDINKILLSGGLVETYSLLGYLKENLSKRFSKLQVLSFDDNVKSSSEYAILSYEDSVYAPAVGGAIISLNDIQIKTITSLSYATWVYNGDYKVLDIFVSRGTEFKDGSIFTTNIRLRNEGVPKNEEMFSTYITMDDVKKYGYERCWPITSDKMFVIGEPGTQSRRHAQRLIDLKVVSGGVNGKIYFTHNNHQCKLMPGSFITAKEGVIVDKNGRATPIIYNTTGPKYVEIQYLNSSMVHHVKATDIKICTNGLKTIMVSND